MARCLRPEARAPARLTPKIINQTVTERALPELAFLLRAAVLAGVCLYVAPVDATRRRGYGSKPLVAADGPPRALELRDGTYVQVARVEGAQAWTATAPYAVTVVPADLLR